MKIRENLILILFWLMTILAAIEFGILWELKGIEGAKKKMLRLEINQMELAGKVEAHGAILRGKEKGRAPQIP